MLIYGARVYYAGTGGCTQIGLKVQAEVGMRGPLHVKPLMVVEPAGRPFTVDIEVCVEKDIFFCGNVGRETPRR